jgi:hypothetical protein
MHTRHPTPDKDAIALLAPFERLGLNRITLVNTGPQADDAYEQLLRAKAWGFDTESKPTFKAGEQSDGPHVLQLATADHAWVFQLHEPPHRTPNAPNHSPTVPVPKLHRNTRASLCEALPTPQGLRQRLRRSIGSIDRITQEPATNLPPVYANPNHPLLHKNDSPRYPAGNRSRSPPTDHSPPATSYQSLRLPPNSGSAAILRAEPNLH